MRRKRLFSDKTSAFGSLGSLVLVIAMLMFYWFNLPAVMVSFVGRVFAVCWGMTAALILLSHLGLLIEKRKALQVRYAIERLNRDAQFPQQRDRTYKHRLRQHL